MKYKLFALLAAILLLAGCNNEDDVLEIFTGKTWKLTRITTEGSSNRFLPGLWDNENSYNNSIEKLNIENNYVLVFYGDPQSSEYIASTFNANGINATITMVHGKPMELRRI